MFLFLVTPSLDQVRKYSGFVGLIAYFLAVLLGLYLVGRRVLPYFASAVTERQAFRLGWATLLLLTILFAAVYPIVNSGIVGGGSDDDDASNVAVRELYHGRYPYYARTYLGNTIHALPGALFLAAPFVLLGTSAYQNLFWLLGYFLVLRKHLQDGRLALLLLWVPLVFSPGILQQVFTGTGHLSNSLYVLLPLWWMARSVIRSDLGPWHKVWPAALWGVGLSSRANFVLLIPLAFAFLFQNAGWKPACRYVGLACLSFVVVTAPFYLCDRRAFSPLETVGSLSRFEDILPFSAIVLTSVTGLLSLTLSFQRLDSSAKLFRNCAIVQAFPVIAGLVLSTVQSKALDLDYAGYGLLYLISGY